jgi:hypothetical protein
MPREQTVTWNRLLTLLGILTIVLVAAIGGAAAWLHSDFTEFKGDVRDLRSDTHKDIADLNSALGTVRSDSVKAIDGVREQVAATNAAVAAANTKLETIAQQAVVLNTKLETVGQQATATNARLDTLIDEMRKQRLEEPRKQRR